MKYTIAAYPTLYKGVRFRSRLEARWAAFFDLIGIRWVYEPLDLGIWSPDFLLKADGEEVLAEVKPVTEFDADAAKKMVVLPDEDDGRAYPALLQLGLQPWTEQLYYPDRIEKRVRIGWFVEKIKGDDEPSPEREALAGADGGWVHIADLVDIVLAAADKAALRYKFPWPAAAILWRADTKAPYIWPRIVPAPADDSKDWDKSFPEFLERSWNEAGSAVQWRPVR